MTRAEKAERNELMREYKSQGHTMQEVADRFGLTKHSAQRICKGINPQKRIVTPSNKGVLKPDDGVAEMIEQRLTSVEYFGNYTGCDGRVDLRCKECGTIFNRSMISVRKQHCSCPVCRETELSNAREQRRIAKEAAQEERKRKAEVNKIRNAKQLQMVVCSICGETFLTWNTNRCYCSADCRKESARRYASYNRGSDDRLNSENIVDKDISLEKLFARDKGICQICGGLCDYDDYYINENGTFIAGDMYPSRDHIVPLEQGGKHAWDNIRLAHRRCNLMIYWTSQRFTPSRSTEHRLSP